MYDRDELVNLLDPALSRHVDHVIDRHREVYEDNDLDDQVNRMCLADSRMFMVGLNLTYTDRASMAASTEVRVPFIDPEVFRAAFSIPGPEKIRGRVQKAPLKEAARGWLPDEVIDRPKASFGVPLRAWVTNDLRELVDDVLLRGDLVGSGFLQRESLQRLVDDQRAGRRDESKQVWQLLCLEYWYRNVRAAGVATA
jgi:asparagine synthase (glutamine-hydrolysing)